LSSHPKEPHILNITPKILSKVKTVLLPPYIAEKEPCTPSETACISSTEACILLKEAYYTCVHEQVVLSTLFDGSELKLFVL